MIVARFLRYSIILDQMKELLKPICGITNPRQPDVQHKPSLKRWPVETHEHYEGLQSRYPVSQPIFEPGTYECETGRRIFTPRPYLIRGPHVHLELHC